MTLLVTTPMSLSPLRNKISRLQMIKKPDQSDLSHTNAEKQKNIDVKMQESITSFPEVFSGIRKVKINLIQIHLTDTKQTPVAQKLPLVALHLMDPLKKHLEELV